jgi:hypothetical protein
MNDKKNFPLQSLCPHRERFAEICLGYQTPEQPQKMRDLKMK